MRQLHWHRAILKIARLDLAILTIGEFSDALLNEALNRYVEITWYGTAVLTDITNNIKHYVYFGDGDIEEVNRIQCAY